MTLISTKASASAPMPAPTPLADGWRPVATGTIGPAAGVPGRLETSFTAAAASRAPADGPERERKRGIAWLASTANAFVAVRLTDVCRHFFLRSLELVHVIFVTVQRLSLPARRQRAVAFTQVFVPLRVVHVDALAAQRFTRLVTLHVSGFGLAFTGGVITGVPRACAAPTAGAVAGPATAGAAGTAIPRSRSVRAATDARWRGFMSMVKGVGEAGRPEQYIGNAWARDPR
jgi:hypothetical protein